MRSNVLIQEYKDLSYEFQLNGVKRDKSGVK